MQLTIHRRIILESPYAGPTETAVQQNVKYAQAAMHDSLSRGESPYASHLLYTHDLHERVWGIEAGFAWREVTDRSVFYIDRGVSGGMVHGARHADEQGAEIIVRSLDRHVTTYALWLAASKLGLGADVGIRPTGPREATVYTR
jgi:hypothetical protein